MREEGLTGPYRPGGWDEDVVINSARRAAQATEAVVRQASEIARLATEVSRRMSRGGKLLFCGNGGSAAAAQHFSAEFTGKLSLDRAPWPAISLTTDSSALTAIANDYGFDSVYARQVKALARPDDVVVGLTTSGKSANVLAAFDAAREVGALTVALTGPSRNVEADWQFIAGVSETARVQEIHELILHALSALVERRLTPGLPDDRATDPWAFVLSVEEAVGFRQWLRESGQTLATTNGVFDLLHKGHRTSLTEASKSADRLLVLINDDASVRRLKGRERPIRSVGERIEDLWSLPCVSHVVIMSEDDPVSLLGLLEPDVHLKGAEYRDRPMPEAETVVAHGGRVEFINLEPGYSTSAQVTKMTGGRNAQE